MPERKAPADRVMGRGAAAWPECLWHDQAWLRPLSLIWAQQLGRCVHVPCQAWLRLSMVCILAMGAAS
ncbi:MAG: hypothetical protein ACYCZF_16955 [Anaerolineae bacterium]